jgi:SAM-dependent methyltransferase
LIEIWHSQIRRPGESQRAYDAIYGDEGIRLLDSFYLWILKLVNPRPGGRFLDVSCGQGALVGFARRTGAESYGLDFSNVAIRRASDDIQHPCFIVGNGARLPYPDQCFDYVTCIGSLEHFTEPLTGMQEIRRVLRGDGTACILLPNTFSLLGNVNHARRHGDVFDDGQPIQRYNTRLGWTRMLVQSGLRVQRVEKYELTWPRTRQDLGWYLRRPRHFAHLLIGLAVPLNLANCHVFVCARAEA